MQRPHRQTIFAIKVQIDHALAWVMDRAVRAGARPFLRAVLGSWPSPADIREFRAAHREGGHLARPLHALSTIGNARRLLTAATLEAWLPEPIYGGTDALILGRRPRIAFMHLEKTGGTSVEEFLLQQYHPVQVVAHPRGGDTPAHILIQDDDARQRALLYGHYDLPFLRTFDPARRVFTVMRDPRARILSMYYYWRSSSRRADREPNEAARAATQLPLLEFLRCDLPEVRNSIHNFYARRLTGDLAGYDMDPIALDRQGTTHAALDALNSLDFVGITERMDESLRLLADKWQFIPPPVTPRTNVGDENPRLLPAGFLPVVKEPITPEIEVELGRLTDIDALLYQAALSMFDSALAAKSQSIPA
jgi:hypothetical protein